MSHPVITVEKLEKKYSLRHQRNEPYTTLRDVLTDRAKNLFRRNGNKALTSEDFWALKEVSFEVKRGEVLGIIGRNGAGKSTLLKILSRITEPTEGRVRIRGRVASLLEVGTGFHPELTGRENIFLNGAILGMTKAEIKRNFDEIVAFAEIEKFLDTPVKRYSSGMYVRLAFAVAAHLEPEILIIDEVLAVGDAEFQKKCVGKMGQAAGEGRTVLFVSHNLAVLTQLCERAIWLDGGRLKLDDQSRGVVASYLSASRSGRRTWVRSETQSPESPIIFDAVDVSSAKDESVLKFDSPIALKIAYTVARETKNACVLARITDNNGVVVFTSWDTDSVGSIGARRLPGQYRVRCDIPASLLRPGQYDVSVGVYEPNVRVWCLLDRVVTFEISPTDCFINPRRVGVITPVLKWSTITD